MGAWVLASGARQAPAPVVARSPHELFVAQCATCHGEKGDGKGTTVLDRPARSFLDGGFSYGNTPEAVLRTITHGIPGSRMPSFAEALGEAERKALADYVIGLGPAGVSVRPGESVIIVRDRAVVVRGKLPRLEANGPEIPRGLLVGLPSGLSFEYRGDDVRLLAVRSGEFADRCDWGGRGGAALAPLGQRLRSLASDEPAFLLGERGCNARLKSTVIDGAEATLAYDLFLEEKLVRQVRETPRTYRCALGLGWQRSFHAVARGDQSSDTGLAFRVDVKGARRPIGFHELIVITPTDVAGRYDVVCVRGGECRLSGAAPTVLVHADAPTWSLVEIPGVELPEAPDEQLARAQNGLEEKR